MTRILLGTVKYEQRDLGFYLSSYDNEPIIPVSAIYAREANGEMYAIVTVNLAEYGFFPKRGYIVISHDIVYGDKTFLKLFIDTFCLEETQEPLGYGYTQGIYISLKPKYVKMIRP